MSLQSILSGDGGRWVRRGDRIVVLPSAAGGGSEEGEVAATTAGVIDPRIDVFAQRALLRMAKGDAAARADAAGMLGAVKTGRLAGIYKEDQRVPAMRAKAMGIGWWRLIPKGEDAAVVPDRAGGAPIIVFRDSVRSSAARLDPALRKAWASLRLPPVPVSPLVCEVPAPVRAAARLREASALDARSWWPPGDPCSTVSLLRDCPRDRLERAICEFKYRANNPRLVCNGQFYWFKLAREALELVGPPARPPQTVDGAGLFSQLTAHYLQRLKPKNPADLQEWFVRTRGRNVSPADAAALGAVSGTKCFDTVSFMARAVEHPRFPVKGVNCLGSPGPDQLIAGVQGGDPCLRYAPGLADRVRRLRKTLDAGFLVRAGVTWPSDCNPAPGHYVLIFGHDGGDRFVYWNTVQAEDGPFGASFGIILHRNDALRIQRGGTGSHFVTLLEPLPSKGYRPTC